MADIEPKNPLPLVRRSEEAKRAYFQGWGAGYKSALNHIREAVHAARGNVRAVEVLAGDASEETE